ncbi:hypothetical protein RRG08_039481 [Elysia crispata]|uniref:Uncharacterized protein n=1 Tax=Elysia crispata TaxID=231223 RepID=A0AAE0YLI8_9GAST|nr:hypothetical protein RRG08_039481 [Elysia crispata]
MRESSRQRLLRLLWVSLGKPAPIAAAAAVSAAIRVITFTTISLAIGKIGSGDGHLSKLIGVSRQRLRAASDAGFEDCKHDKLFTISSARAESRST